MKEHRKPKLGGVADKIVVLCVLHGEREDEQHILEHFKPFLVDGQKEVFHPATELKDYIRWLRDQHYCCVSEDRVDEIPFLEIVNPTSWMPEPERRKEPPTQEGLFSELPSPWLFDLPPPVETQDDFYTNPIVIAAATATFGGRIDLDPASHYLANRVVKATKFYQKNDNGLSKEWSGNIWLNPPFSAWEYWVPKIISEWESGRVTQMCVLAATRTITANYFSEIKTNCEAMCIFDGRIAFWGDRAGQPNEGHVVFYYGRCAERFQKHFSEIGHVFVTWEAQARLMQMAAADVPAE